MLILLLTLIFIILVAILGWHILFAALGGVIIIGATLWSIAIVSVVLFSLAVLLLFLFAAPGIFVIGILFALWTLAAIILFPVLFPLLLPLLVIFAFIAYMRRKNRVSLSS